MKRSDLARENFLKGYNCAQAVALAFSDVAGMSEEQLLKALSPFGGGFGRLREVCGAFSAVTFVYGCVRGYCDPKDMQAKKAVYADIQALAEECRKANGSIVCRELLGLSGKDSPAPAARTEEYYKKRPCTEICAVSAQILAEKLGLTERIN